MARQPKNFVIGSIGRIVPAERSTPVRISATGSVPSRFKVSVVLAEPSGIRADLDLQVVPGGQPLVRELVLTPIADHTASISTTTLRRVLVEHIVRTVIAVAAASSPELIDRPDVGRGAFQLGGETDGEVHLTPPYGLSDQAFRAAQIYRTALAAGSPAPTGAVAVEMNVSRSQASRYVRAARDAGVLPEVEGK